MANLGFYQVKSMGELHIRLTENFSASRLTKKLNLLKLVTQIMVVIGFTAMIFLASFFMVVMK